VKVENNQDENLWLFLKTKLIHAKPNQ